MSCSISDWLQHYRSTSLILRQWNVSNKIVIFAFLFPCKIPDILLKGFCMYKKHLLYVTYTRPPSQRTNKYRACSKTSSFRSARKNSKEHLWISCISAIERFRVLMTGIVLKATRVPEAFLVLPNLLYLFLLLGKTWAKRIDLGYRNTTSRCSRRQQLG